MPKNISFSSFSFHSSITAEKARKNKIDIALLPLLLLSTLDTFNPPTFPIFLRNSQVNDEGKRKKLNSDPSSFEALPPPTRTFFFVHFKPSSVLM
jgi:hypothetical protein